MTLALRLTVAGLLLATHGCGEASSDAEKPGASGTPEAFAELRIEPATVVLDSGQTRVVKAIGITKTGSAHDVTAEVTWNSGPANVATIDAIGSIEAVSSGDAAIGASLRGLSAAASVHVRGWSFVGDVASSTSGFAGARVAVGPDADVALFAEPAYQNPRLRQYSPSAGWMPEVELAGAIGGAVMVASEGRALIVSFEGHSVTAQSFARDGTKQGSDSFGPFGPETDGAAMAVLGSATTADGKGAAVLFSVWEQTFNDSEPHGLYALRWSESGGWAEPARVDIGAPASALYNGIAIDDTGRVVVAYATRSVDDDAKQELIVMTAAPSGPFAPAGTGWQVPLASDRITCLDVSLNASGEGLITWSASDQSLFRNISGASAIGPTAVLEPPGPFGQSCPQGATSSSGERFAALSVNLGQQQDVTRIFRIEQDAAATLETALTDTIYPELHADMAGNVWLLAKRTSGSWFSVRRDEVTSWMVPTDFDESVGTTNAYAGSSSGTQALVFSMGYEGLGLQLYR